VRTQTGEDKVFSGRNDNQYQRGVAIILSKEASSALENWNPVSDRIITVRFNSRHIKTTIIQFCAPTNDIDTQEKDDFYERLQQVYDKTPQHDIIITMPDWNATLRDQTEGEGEVVGMHGLGGGGGAKDGIMGRGSKGFARQTTWPLQQQCSLTKISISALGPLQTEDGP